MIAKIGLWAISCLFIIACSTPQSTTESETEIKPKTNMGAVLIPSESEPEVKRLYLIRHAKSSRENPDWTDFERPLNKRGKKDAPFMGKKMKERGIMPDFILSSPSARTRATIGPIASEVGFDTSKIEYDRSIYRCPSSAVVEAISKLDDQYSTVFIVGHNPAMTSVSNQLIKADTTLEKVPTTGIVGVEFEGKTWSEAAKSTGKFLFFDYPKRYPERQ